MQYTINGLIQTVASEDTEPAINYMLRLMGTLESLEETAPSKGEFHDAIHNYLRGCYLILKSKFGSSNVYIVNDLLERLDEIISDKLSEVIWPEGINPRFFKGFELVTARSNKNAALELAKSLSDGHILWEPLEGTNGGWQVWYRK